GRERTRPKFEREGWSSPLGSIGSLAVNHLHRPLTTSSANGSAGNGRNSGAAPEPRSWTTLGGLGLRGAISKSLPYRAQLALGRAGGRIAHKVCRKRRHI